MKIECGPWLKCMKHYPRGHHQRNEPPYEFEPVYRSIEFSCGLQVEPKLLGLSPGLGHRVHFSEGTNLRCREDPELSVKRDELSNEFTAVSSEDEVTEPAPKRLSISSCTVNPIPQSLTVPEPFDNYFDDSSPHCNDFTNDNNNCNEAYWNEFINFQSIPMEIENDDNWNWTELPSLIGSEGDEMLDVSLTVSMEHEDISADYNDVEMVPIYPGASFTAADSFLAILTFSLRHKLDGNSIKDLIELIDLHCPKSPTSYYYYQKHFNNMNMPINITEYCSNCYRSGTMQNKKCNACHSNLPCSYLLSFPVIAQLRTLFSRREFVEALRHRFIREKKSEMNIEEIYDGALYKNEWECGFLKDPMAISFIWNTDGAQLYKSSQLAIWPFYLAVNELPHQIRFLKENVIMGCLWCGPVKPIANIMLEGLYDDLQELFEGVTLDIVNYGPGVVRGMLLCGTADIPARGTFLNMVSHAGHYSCPKCVSEGQRIGGAQVFPPIPDIVLRTRENVLADADKAETPEYQKRGNCHGIRGHTQLENLTPDFVRSTSIDVMHGVYMALRRTLQLWFDSSYRAESFNRSTFIHVVDERLKYIQTPSFIKRPPRSLQKHLAYWKASEFKNFFYYYSIPVLQGVISEIHYRHYLLLVIAIYNLNKDSISEQDLELSDHLLNEYVKQFEFLYGLRYMPINIHQLIHLTQIVRDLGPLWVTSCFPFENLNGQILGLVHGTRFAEKQIAHTLQRYFALPTLIREMNEGPVKNYCEKLTGGKRIKLSESIEEGIHIVGCCQRMNPIPQYVIDALYSVNIIPGKVHYFDRMKIGGFIFTTLSYGRASRTCSACISYEQQGTSHVGIIIQFLKVSTPSSPPVIQEDESEFGVIVRKCFIIKSFSSQFPTIEVPHLKEYTLSAEIAIIHPNAITNMNVLINQGNQFFIATPPNFIEKE